MAENTNTEREALLAAIAATAPESIYLDLGDADDFWPDNANFKDFHEVTWSDDNATGNGIKYVRADRASLSLPAAGQEPVAHQYLGADGKWHDFIDARHCKNTIESGLWQIRPLYAAPQPAVAAGWVPMQPIVWAKDGCIRFLANRMVNDLYEFARPRGMGLNEMAAGDYTAEERMQFAQLIGCSVSGYGGLSYVSDESADKADAIAAILAAQREVKP